jgi:hypothetical protein
MQLKKPESKKPRDPLFASSSSDEEEEESNNDGRLVQSKVRSVLPRCGKKRDGQRLADFAKWREEQKRKKSEEADPPYVPEEAVPRKKNRKSGSNTDVRFVCFVILFVNTDEFI